MYPLFVTNRLDLIVMETAYVIWFLPELIYTFTKIARKNVQLHDRFSKLSVMAGIYLGIFTSLSFAFAARTFSIPWHRTSIFAVGILMIVAGTALRWYSVRVLGKYFTLQVAIQPGQTVVESGPYRWVRHPSYSGSLLSLLGFGLVLSNWLSVISVLLFAILGYSYRIWVEESALTSSLGEPYREYMKRTKRIVPFVI